MPGKKMHEDKGMVCALNRQSHAEAVLVPGLNPHAVYSSRLSARSALYTEFHLLMEGQTEVLPLDAYRSLVVEENCLARGSISARKKLWKELKTRYLLDSASPLFLAFWDEWQRCTSEAERSLTAYILFALNDRLVTDLGLKWLFPLLRRAPAELRVVDVLAFINRAVPKHPEVAGWSEQTRLAVAQKYCASVRDFGLAKGTVRKVTVRPALYGAPIRLLVRVLRLVDTSTLELIQAPIFRLLALDSLEVIDALGELNRFGALQFRMQGDIIELHVAEAA